MQAQVDTEPYAVARDKAVTTMAMEHGVVVKPSVSHTLYVGVMVVGGGMGVALFEGMLCWDAGSGIVRSGVEEGPV